jgi:hypothetical protein
MYAVLQGMQWAVIGSQKKQCYPTEFVKSGGGREEVDLPRGAPKSNGSGTLNHRQVLEGGT